MRQSLTLWREIVHDMFRLWCLGEEDLLSETARYKLTDTGQGKQRVQQSPRTFKAMQVPCPGCCASAIYFVACVIRRLGVRKSTSRCSFSFFCLDKRKSTTCTPPPSYSGYRDTKGIRVRSHLCLNTSVALVLLLKGCSYTSRGRWEFSTGSLPQCFNMILTQHFGEVFSRRARTAAQLAASSLGPRSLLFLVVLLLLLKYIQ